MKKIIAIAFLSVFLIPSYAQTTRSVTKAEKLKVAPATAADKNDRNNNFYDNEDTFLLPMSDLEVAGEVENPGKVDFSALPKRSVIIKETLLTDDGTDKFVGAYRYDGYSLFDILNDRIPKKKNASEFKPIIDLFIVVENAKGEKVILSWGEIYYPNNLHTILIATSVMRIVPSKTKELWPLPEQSKLIVANDLVTERNISSPVKITVISYPRNYPINRDLSPMVSETVNFFIAEKTIDSFTKLENTGDFSTLHTIFYGKGRGIHSTQPFTGLQLKTYLGDKVKINRENMKNGVLVFAGLDGYRAVYSFSEVMNRNDQQEVLLVPTTPGEDGGNFRIFPSCDFFSDRAVKGLTEIRMEVLKP